MSVLGPAALAQLRDALAVLCDATQPKARRALAVTLTCAALTADEQPPVVAAAQPGGFGTNMYAFGVRHVDAQRWDGRSSRSGTITFVDDERIEQYIGQQHWLCYTADELGRPGFVVGDRVRIGRRNEAVFIEAIGANRCPNAPVERPTLRSGMAVFRALRVEPADIAAAAGATAERYGANVEEQNASVAIVFSKTARLQLSPCTKDWPEAEAFAGESLAAAVRLDACVAADDAAASLVAESALVHCAALLATAGGTAVALDDSGAYFPPDILYDLAVRDETRAALFTFAAAAAQRAWPEPSASICGRSGAYDELTICSTQAWSARYAGAAVRRALDALGDARLQTGDPIVPAAGEVFGPGAREDRPARQDLIRLSYETVDIDIAYLNLRVESDAAATFVRERRDLAVLLGGVPQSAIVLGFGNRTADTQSETFACEMRRADALVAALAAALARRGSWIAFDAAGMLLGADDLIELAVQRRGKAAWWGTPRRSLCAP